MQTPRQHGGWLKEVQGGEWLKAVAAVDWGSNRHQKERIGTGVGGGVWGHF
jgi:hypothetical protein